MSLPPPTGKAKISLISVFGTGGSLLLWTLSGLGVKFPRWLLIAALVIGICTFLPTAWKWLAGFGLTPTVRCLLLGVLLVGASFMIGPQIYSTLFAGPVVISPKSFDLHTGKFSITSALAIANTTNASVYDVLVKIWTEDPGVSSNSMRIEPTMENPNGPLVDVGLDANGKMTQAHWDVFMFDLVDMYGHQTVAVRIHELTPHERRPFKLWGTAPIKSTAQAIIWHWSDKQEAVMSGTNESRVPFYWPEISIMKGFRTKPLTTK